MFTGIAQGDQDRIH
jgi:hypothetical protein